MRIWDRFWNDEHGVLLSAEAVVVGTIAVVGLTTGLTVVSRSVSEELRDVAFAIRSLDQSYSIPAQEGCGARTAGSSFTQEPVQKSLNELREVVRKSEREEKSQSDRLQEKVKAQEKKRDVESKKQDRI
ncbi:MAG: hypothetical protein ACK58L_06775 [Planctomycetota bacterium]